MYGPGAADGLRRPAHRHRTFAVVLPSPGGRTVRHGQTGSDDRRPPGESQRLGSRGRDSRHTSIEGFANFHEFQVGGVVVAPTVGELQTVPGPLDNPDAGYRSRFDKKDEVARPRLPLLVLLKDYGVKAEPDGHRTGRSTAIPSRRRRRRT